MTITFEVLGTPQHQGSIRAFMPKDWKRPVLTTTNKNLKPWRQEVAAAAMEAMLKADPDSGCEISAALCVEADFVFVRPKSIKKQSAHKTTRPDLDKLARALLDSMTGVIWADDAQVSQLLVSKRFGDCAFTRVRITMLEG